MRERKKERKKGNRSGPLVTKRKEKVINVVEMVCPSWRNRRETDTRKTEKYETVRRELMERNQGFRESEE